MSEYQSVFQFENGSDLFETMWSEVDADAGHACEYCRDYFDGPDVNPEEPAVHVVFVETNGEINATETLCDDCHFNLQQYEGQEIDQETFDGLWKMFMVHGKDNQDGYGTIGVHVE